MLKKTVVKNTDSTYTRTFCFSRT